MNWQQDQQLPLSCFSSKAEPNAFLGSAGGVDHHQNLDEILAQAMKSDPGLESSCDEFVSIGEDLWGYGNLPGFGMNGSVARTLSCPPAVAAAMAEAATAVFKGEEIVLPEKMNSGSLKRKADKPPNHKVATENETKDKKLKGCIEAKASKTTGQNGDSKNMAIKNNNETSDTSKENSKITEVQKPDYIHVRARRGQATDSHSLAERVRREKISERMKYLQDLVPGCNKVVGKAGMLDEIINYVQSLQRQVEFLSMKLAAVNPGAYFNLANFFTKEVFPTNGSEFHPPIEALPEISLPQNYHLDASHQVVSSSGLEIDANHHAALRRTISAPVSIPGTVFEQPCFNHPQSCSSWDSELQGIYGLEFQQSLPSQLCPGFSGGSHVRMGM